MKLFHRLYIADDLVIQHVHADDGRTMKISHRLHIASAELVDDGKGM